MNERELLSFNKDAKTCTTSILKANALLVLYEQIILFYIYFIGGQHNTIQFNLLCTINKYYTHMIEILG